jgi:oxepin-CoA hydrolase/3-oxo-5,6-dehydrosuberyl-CoA semialdehyde dehydrogenase
VASAEHPSGIVKWHVEVFDADFENRPESQKSDKDTALVAVATILTMVQKKQETFVEMTDSKIDECLSKLSEDTKSKWGIMTPQHMIEHLEYTYKIAAAEIQDFEISTPEKILDKVKNSLWNYDKFPKNSQFPLLEKDTLDDLKHENLAIAIEKFKEQRKKYIEYFKEHPDAKLSNLVFGELNRYEWYLLERKHLNHHFEQFGLI